MRQVVENYFPIFTKKFESDRNHFYLDVNGDVTIGLGIRIATVQAASGLVFLRPSGLQATPSEVSADWLKVHNRQDLKKRGGVIYATIATLRATPDSLLKLFDDQLVWVESVIRKNFPTWEDWPADAQMGTLSIAWAAGPNTFATGWPNFRAAANAGNWGEAAKNCHMADFANPGLVPRNAANVILFRNAARGSCPDTLYYPQAL